MNTPEPVIYADDGMLGECGRVIMTMVERQLASLTPPNTSITLGVLRASHCLAAGEVYCYVFLCELIARSQALIRCSVCSHRTEQAAAELEAAEIAVTNYEIENHV